MSKFASLPQLQISVRRESGRDQSRANFLQSSEQHIPKKSLASKVGESASSPPSSRSDSSSRRTLFPSTLPKSRTVVSLPSPSANPYDTNSSMVLQYEEHAMVS